MSSLFARLKLGTERQHRDIEAIVDPMHTFSSLDAYKAHLVNTWIFHASLEDGLQGLDWAALGIDFGSRRKTPLLEQDLHILGVPRPARDAGRAAFGEDGFEHEGTGREGGGQKDLDFALGCLYVLEGATLGGQVISRYLATLGIGPSNGGLFFNGYGTSTGAMWKSFQSKATEHCETEGQIDAAVRGAVWTFEQFRLVMARRSVTSHAP